MSNSKPAGRRRSLRVIIKFFRFIIMLAIIFMIFIVSFGVTLMIKNDYFKDDETVSDAPIKAGVPEIKTLFDERNKQSFKPTDSDKKSSDKKSSDKKSSDKKSSDKKSAAIDDNKPTEIVNDDSSPPNRRNEDNLTLLAKMNRVTAIKPAVSDKVNSIPNYVPIEQIPYPLTQAVVSVEDTRFYKHKGFDVIGIARAVFVNAKSGEIQEGASTITQQTVKNLFLNSDRTFTRKFEELILSIDLEKNFDKDKIMELYLNSIYFGSNFYGIYDAAHGYFNKEPAELSVAECAMLAGLPNAPSVYSPYVDFHNAKKRQLVVINAMEKMGTINSREAELARVENLEFAR